MAVIDGATATTDPRGACYHLVFRWLDRSALYVPIVQRPRTWPFQGQNTGSNPVGDASLRSIAGEGCPARSRAAAEEGCLCPRELRLGKPQQIRSVRTAAESAE
jgi:hypothetical protein